ncbi:hypothetical protein KACHI17_03850 [Sediminibacterium sp. KACHI17]|uniref:Transglutaminase-like domain-containing protein n=1 Tax=Sediminibacterium sp. KACHI17 TaxID=1751071 RepID=A0AAT9GFU9_9BACT
MKNICLLFIFFCASTSLFAQTGRTHLSETIDTTELQLSVLTQDIVKDQNSSYGKARAVLNWLSNRLDWKATDYQTRTVNQILARGGGNCFELAKVYMAMIKSIHLPYRAIAEINLHVYSDERQKTAEEKVVQVGNRMSVFGRQHNDHRWLEVLDEETGKWEPVDPSMNVIGTEQWLKARVWFGPRMTIDTSITNDMIVPVAVFVVDQQQQLSTDRSRHYLIEAFNQLYQGKLTDLPSWKSWTAQIKQLSPHVKAAFEGKENLHLREKDIAKLVKTYQDLKREFIQKNKLLPFNEGISL